MKTGLQDGVERMIASKICQTWGPNPGESYVEQDKSYKEDYQEVASEVLKTV